jgi:multidrug efflux pump subunit AcrA (membrane-fusion protein)
MKEKTVSAKQVHSDDIQEIIGAPPSWLLKWGISILLMILLILLSLSTIISYPDVINTQLKIRSVQQPVTVSAPHKGRLLKVLTRNSDIIKEKQALAIVATTEGLDTLLATSHGTLSYLGIVHEGMQIDPAQPIFTVSDDCADFFGELIILQSSVAKVQPGQQVIVKLRSYPYQEYGALGGRIKYITEDLRNNSLYLAEVKLDDIHFTNIKKRINLKQSMIADAEIITQNSSLFKRITSNLFRSISH